MLVESGNARTLAIQRAYRERGGDDYRAWLDRQGYETTGFKEPVLVRRRVTELSPEDRAAFTREANERTTASFSAGEQAGADA